MGDSVSRGSRIRMMLVGAVGICLLALGCEDPPPDSLPTVAPGRVAAVDRDFSTVPEGKGGNEQEQSAERPPPAPEARSDEPERALPSAEPELASPSAEPEQEDLALLGSRLTQRQVIQRLHESPPVRFKPVGTSSIVYHVRLQGAVDAAFKPRTRNHPSGHLAEVAAYRIARILGLDNVPPAVLRRVSQGALRRRLHPAFEDAWPEIRDWTLWNARGESEGAFLYWIPEMEDLGLESRRKMTEWRKWLAQGRSIPAGRKALARDLSNVVLLDYLIGNWDRFSGGNLQGLPSGRRVFIRDHNAAFAAPLPAATHRRVWGHLHRTQKFDRSAVQRLASLEFAELRAAMDLPGGSLLDDRQLKEVFARAKAATSYIQALAARYGTDAVLSL